MHSFHFDRNLHLCSIFHACDVELDIVLHLSNTTSHKQKKCLCDYIILQIQVNIFATYAVFACRTQTMRANTVQPVKATIINQNTYRWFFEKEFLCMVNHLWHNCVVRKNNEIMHQQRNRQTWLQHFLQLRWSSPYPMILTILPSESSNRNASKQN